MKKFGFQIQFLISVVLLLLVWLLLASNVLGVYTRLNEVLLDSLQWMSLGILETLGHNVFSDNRHFGISGSSGVLLGAPCDGFSLMFLNTGFIIALPGKLLRKVIWISCGIISIHVLNLIRVVVLVRLTDSHPHLLAFNHDYTFTMGMYILIFLSWVFYVRSLKI